MVDHEETLTGGNVAAAVVRVGQAVHKPVTTATPAVAALLQHLKASGFDGAPEHLGLDDIGRQILEYIPGVTADRLAPLDLAELHRLLAVALYGEEIATVAADDADLPIGRLTVSAARFEVLPRCSAQRWTLRRGYALLQVNQLTVGRCARDGGTRSGPKSSLRVLLR
jgi:hypothetical protein